MVMLKGECGGGFFQKGACSVSLSSNIVGWYFRLLMIWSVDQGHMLAQFFIDIDVWPLAFLQVEKPRFSSDLKIINCNFYSKHMAIFTDSHMDFTFINFFLKQSFSMYVVALAVLEHALLTKLASNSNFLSGTILFKSSRIFWINGISFVHNILSIEETIDEFNSHFCTLFNILFNGGPNDLRREMSPH